MKYIRTKGGVYEIVEGIVLTSFPSQYQIKNKNKSVFMSEVINQADTIEELCDEFVLIRNSITRVYPKKHLLEESITGYCIGDEVYGAIWTDKGLIYVAKMDDKGELELL